MAATATSARSSPPAAPRPAPGTRGGSAQRGREVHVVQVEQGARLGRRVMARITELTALTSSGLVLMLVAAGSWALAYYIGGRPLYLLSYGCAGVLIGSWLYTLRRPPLEGRRSEVRARLREGETITVDVTLEAGRRLSTLILEEKLPPSLGASPRIPIADLAEGESAGHTYQLTCWRRGVYTIGPLVVRWGDPFGLTSRRMAVADEVELFVHPRVEPALDRPMTRQWEDPPQRPPHSKPWPSGMDFYGMRAYSPGDDIRNVVWRAFARTGSLLVREAEQGVTDRLLLLVDLDRDAHSKGTISESFEEAMRAVASVGVHHLKSNYTVTTEGNAEAITRPLRGGGQGTIELLDALARLNPVDGKLDDLIARTCQSVANNVEVMLITPRLTTTAILRLRLLVERGISVRVLALLWDEEATDHLGQAAAMGLRVIEVGPTTNLTMALRYEIGSGLRA